VERRKAAIRGSFEDVCEAQKELREKIMTAKWSEIEELLDRAFCGFMPHQLEDFLAQVRLLDLQDDENVRWFLAKLLANERNWALRQSFQLSLELPYRERRIPVGRGPRIRPSREVIKRAEWVEEEGFESG